MKSQLYTFDRVVRMVIGLTVLLGLFFLVQRLSGVLLPFIIAWLLAYFLHPIVIFFQYKLKLRNRILAIVCTMLLFVSVMTGVVWFLTPMVSAEIQRVSELIALYSKDLDLYTMLPVSLQNDIRNYFAHLNVSTFLQNENVIVEIRNLAPHVWNLIYGSLSFLFGLVAIVFIFLYTIFILLDYEIMSEGWQTIIPPKNRILISEIVNDLKVGMNRYFRGQALVALSVGILFSIGFSIIQLPLAIVLGLFIGILSMVPYLHVLGVIPALLLALLKSEDTGQSYLSVLIGVAIVFIVIQLIQDMILTPRIMGKVTGMSPALILLSLSVWGSLMGIIGMIIALPMTTVIISYYKRFVLKETEIENDGNTEESKVEKKE